MSSCKSTLDKQLGFSLLELMGVLTLVGLLSGIWIVPAYQQWLRHSRLETKARQLLSALQFARGIAIQRDVKVTLCKTDNYESCKGTWENGWMVLANPEKAASPEVLQTYQGLYPHQNLIWKGARHLEAVQFQPLGTSIGHNGRFVLCAKGSKVAWFIFVSTTGRARLEASRDLSYCA